MYRPLALFIGLRYLRAKKRNHFISFISAISFLGISIGVMVLITVLSVMNGFDKEIKQRILVMVPHVTVSQWDGKLENWQAISDIVQKNKNVTSISPVIEGQGMINSNGISNFTYLVGVNPAIELKNSPIEKHMISGSLADLSKNKFSIILGDSLAKSMNAKVGDKVTLIVPKSNITPAGVVPRLKAMKVVGIFKVGYQYDSSYALTDLKSAGILFKMQDTISALQIKTTNLYDAQETAYEIRNKLGNYYTVSDWSQSNTSFFQALKMEKTMMFLILALIIGVATFNMLSSLVMVVTDKQSDIAILRTIGAKRKTIMGIFIVQGMMIGVIGTFIGLVFGVLLSLNITEIVNTIQSLFSVNFLSDEVYLINFLPSHLEISDILNVSIMALYLSFLATLYPAWKASKTQPAEALRYD